jgi:hypothetical protein
MTNVIAEAQITNQKTTSLNNVMAVSFWDVR